MQAWCPATADRRTDGTAATPLQCCHPSQYLLSTGLRFGHTSSSEYSSGCPSRCPNSCEATSPESSVCQRLRLLLQRGGLRLWHTDDSGDVASPKLDILLGHPDEYSEDDWCPIAIQSDTGYLMDDNTEVVSARLCGPVAPESAVAGTATACVEAAMAPADKPQPSARGRKYRSTNELSRTSTRRRERIRRSLVGQEKSEEGCHRRNIRSSLTRAGDRAASALEDQLRRRSGESGKARTALGERGVRGTSEEAPAGSRATHRAAVVPSRRYARRHSGDL